MHGSGSKASQVASPRRAARKTGGEVDELDGQKVEMSWRPVDFGPGLLHFSWAVVQGVQRSRTGRCAHCPNCLLNEWIVMMGDGGCKPWLACRSISRSIFLGGHLRPAADYERDFFLEVFFLFFAFFPFMVSDCGADPLRSRYTHIQA